MLAYVVEVYVKKDFIEKFRKATVSNHENTIKEEGNIRFDLLQSKDDPARFTLYEVYKSEDAVARHKETEHYLNWRKKVADWMAKPRKGIKHNIVAPGDVNQW